MAINTAELLASWKAWENFNNKLRTIKKISLDVFDQQSFGPIKKHAKELAVHNNKLSASFNDVQKQIQETEEKIKNSTRRNEIGKLTKHLEGLKKVAATHPGAVDAGKPKDEKKSGDKKESGGLMGIVKGLFTTEKLLSYGKEILAKGMDQESRIAQLAPRLGGTANAAMAYHTIKGDAQSTPFDMDSMFEANKMLITAGASAEAAREDVLSLGRAVAFSGGGNEQLTKLAEVMAEVRGAGTIAGDDLKKFSAAGLDMYSVLGKSAGEVKDMSFSYDQLRVALHNAGVENGPFAGAMEKMNETAESKMGNFMDSFTGGMATIGTAFLPILKKVFDFGMKLVDTLLPKIMQVIQPIVNILGSIPIDALLSDITNWLGALMAAVGPILQNLQPLFAAIFDALQPVIHAFYQFSILLVSMIGPYIAAIAKLLSTVLSPIIWALGKILTWIIEKVTKVLEFFKPVYEHFTKFINSVANGIGRFLKWVGYGNDKDDKEKQKDLPAQPQQFFLADTNVLPGEKNPYRDTSVWKAGADANGLTTGKKTEAGAADKAAGEITSGGPRVININGVKFTDKIELHVTNAKEGLYDLELRLQEMFLRILNSGAVIQ